MQLSLFKYVNMNYKDLSEEQIKSLVYLGLLYIKNTDTELLASLNVTKDIGSLDVNTLIKNLE